MQINIKHFLKKQSYKQRTTQFLHASPHSSLLAGTGCSTDMPKAFQAETTTLTHKTVAPQISAEARSSEHTKQQ